MLSFGYANIVKDAGVEKFSVVYGPLYFSYIYNIVKYIYNCYGLDTYSGASIEALCLHQLLYTPNICLRTLVLSFPAIEQHIRRACIHAGYLWKLSHLELDIPDPTSWG